jgi:hypothetical protein
MFACAMAGIKSGSKAFTIPDRHEILREHGTTLLHIASSKDGRHICKQPPIAS